MRTMVATCIGVALLVSGCGVSEPAAGSTPPVEAQNDVDSAVVTSEPPATSTPTSTPTSTSVDTIPTPSTTVPATTAEIATSSTAESPTTVATATTTSTTTTTIPTEALDAIALLADLTVADPDPGREPYIRDRYDGDGWADVDGDCLSTRHELLAAYSLIAPTLSTSGCRVETGRWIDPYDGAAYDSELQVSIDHLVPLAEAHRSGAWRWDDDTKHRFANDESPGHLQVVGRDANQAKGDKRPDQWMPRSAAVHCQYAIDWVTTKARYDLSIVAPERAALSTALATCATSNMSIRPVVDAPAPTVVVTAPTTSTTSTIAPSDGPGIVALLACDRWSETVTIGNTGGTSISLAGFLLHDEGAKHSTALDGFGSLGPGEQLRILTGPEATGGPGQVVWKNQNVWNNDGDTAHLIGYGAEQTTNC